ncbi:glutamate--tRNA ligase [Dichotomicrobium thermohalophilum]|uniref:Glutamate--tRNA ligase n=1 Tax=Dichotomicrobium thermohalophilum TaxID=933063 RepID=A0A397PGF8_9HYPH|nr:glutamate--tRNA ligase [Dichotomicrobium thermohalophilum]RIA47553.1 glutamyl-tRNA synthetase [Dichotomicrobium thermohalophilum]
MSEIAVRFAPSPTGLLHIGNIRPALFNWLFARKHGGRFVLRLDDTDIARSCEEYAEAIREDLHWLGLDWDEEVRQSDRLDLYAEAAEKLKAAGRLYPAYETPDELERRRKRQRAQGLPPIYDRAALKLTDEDRAKLEAEGRKPHWRFKLDHREVAWDDLIRGEQTIDAGSLSDPILVRADGTYLYTLPSVVDDIALGITHVIRGEDHVANSGAQIQIFEALGGSVPWFAHHNMLVGAEGESLGKRLGTLSIRQMREDGLEPLAILSHSAAIGTSDPVTAHQSLDELIESFDLDKVSRAPARFDMSELRGVNAKLLHERPYEKVADELSALGVGGGEAFWLAVRGNVTVLSDALEWWQVVQGPVTPVIEDEELCEAAADLLPREPWDGTTWKAWIDAVKAETGRKGRALFHPLRLAITGRAAGPELGALLPLIGREKVAVRLRGNAA